MKGILDSLVDGCRDGFDGIIDGKRFHTDRAYAGGVEIGKCKYKKFLQSTVDHSSATVIPDAPAELWQDLIPLLMVEGEKADATLKKGKRGRQIQLQALSEEDFPAPLAVSLPHDKEFLLRLTGIPSHVELRRMASL